MFVMVKATSYTWPVKLEMPVDGGKFETSTFDATFKKLKQSVLTDSLQKIATDKMDASDFCKEIVLGFSGIKDEAGADIPYSEKSLADLLEIPGVSGAIVRAYGESIAGSKRKN